VVTLDRSKLAAPVFAQAAAFVVVLVIGGFTGHSQKPPAPRPAPSNQASPIARPSSSTTAAAKGTGAKLTIKVVEEGTEGVTVSGSDVRVLKSATLGVVASGTLNTTLEFAVNLPAGAYQACVNPPLGFTSATKGTHNDNGFICLPASVASGPVSVTISLASPTSQAGA
jgi:hypothetical protein